MGYAWRVMGEFFESLFALWSIAAANNGRIGSEEGEDGEREGSRRRAML